jgi:hypothetical protein
LTLVAANARLRLRLGEGTALKGRISRREFMRVGVEAAALAGVAALGGSVVPFAAARPDEKVSAAIDLAVVHGSPGAAARRALDLLGGIGRFVKAGDFVLLKPNMSFATPPEVGATTHPEVVAAVAAECVKAGAKRVLVADHTIREPKVCLEHTGIRAACAPLERVSVTSLNEEAEYEDVPVPRGTALKKTAVAHEVLRADVLINLPVAKSHGAAGVCSTPGTSTSRSPIWGR